MRVPNRARAAVANRRLDGVMAEVAQEKAAALGRMAKRLTDALARLREWDAASAASADASAERAHLVAVAGEALWFLAIQREACGLRDLDEVLREYRVPREVYLRMGPLPPSRR